MATFRNPFPIDSSNPFGQWGWSTMPACPGYTPSDIWNWPALAPSAARAANKVDAKLRSISTNGLWFIFTHEAAKNITNHLHWPGGASGVTLGPGYDMKARTAAEITADMKAIGLSEATAKIVAQAATLSGDKADKFAHDHKKDVDLTDSQQTNLLKHTVKSYEHTVRTSVKVALTQYEFDALVSFAYNPGGHWHSVAHLINTGNVKDAMKKIKASNTSKGKVMLGLTRRREDEVKLFLEGKYEHNGKAIPAH